jgi:hypothetical protein
MPDESTAQSEEPENPPASPEGNRPPADGSSHSAWAARVTASLPAAAKPTRSRRKKILVPVVLAVIGLALLAAGFLMYPRRAEAPAPTSDTLAVMGAGSYVNTRYANSHMKAIYYTVQQLHPDVARLTIDVVLDGTSVPHGAQLLIQLNWLSRRGGFTVLRCSPLCTTSFQPTTALPYIRSPVGGGGVSTATAYFVLKAHSYGVAANGATAAVAFPQVSFAGTQQATMTLTFTNIPAANTYDWSSYPPSNVNNFGTEWVEPVTPGNPANLLLGTAVTNGRVVTGINHTAQAHDSTFTLVVGVLFGIAGGALVAAVQEALHD